MVSTLTNSMSVFDHFMGLVLKGLNITWRYLKYLHQAPMTETVYEGFMSIDFFQGP